MRAIPMVAKLQCGVFTTTQARADGWTRGRLEYAVRRGWLWQPKPGTYALPPDGDDRFELARRRMLQVSAAAVLTMPVMLSHAAALLVRGSSTLTVPDRPCLTVRPRYTGDTDDVHLHRARVWTQELTRVGGLLAGSTARSVVDLTREAGRDEGVVAADAALHLGLTTIDELAAVLRRCAGWPGMRHARDLLDAVDPASESALESISRLRMLDLGLPRPETQVIIRTSTRRFVRRVHFYLDEWGIVGEADGAMKYRGRSDELVTTERRQEVELRDLGLGVARWGWREANTPPLLDRRIRDEAERTRRGGAARNWIAERTHRRAA
ncbi:MAG: type IV toxin-antitoxin system AbiEi family antitoxin domain-containing protein [Jatrophihabitans sp.]|uniref:type IV toxin-antitoxin system AbiEi family antitoxin domain-containing protein n=1 Tax=Jatrophihabitans sp. TaxID=1932789 RepID=UPI003F802D2B